MYGIKWEKGHIHCSFCGKRGHNVTSCNEVTKTYEQTHYHIRTHWPDGTPLSPLQNKPWDIVSNWWQLTRVKQKSWIEMKNREIRQAKRAAKKLKKKPARCSFCRKSGHRRPTCKHHKKFSKKIHRANEVWKGQFAEMINTLGLGVGALIQVPKSSIAWYAPKHEHMLCLVTGYSYSSMNVFSAYKVRDDFRTTPHMTITEVSSNLDLKVGFDRIKPFVDSQLVHSTWNNSELGVVSSMDWKPTSEWLDSSDNQELKYVLQKLSISSKRFPFVNSFIDTWNKGYHNE